MNPRVRQIRQIQRIHNLLEAEVEKERKQTQDLATENKGLLEEVHRMQTGRKLYPNDPCPCGSGLKYKKCCGKKR